MIKTSKERQFAWRKTALFKRYQKKKGYQSIAVLTALSAALLAINAPVAAQYVEPGQIGNKASWETSEYLASWGGGAMKASSAYALGYTGAGVKVGVMDSGSLATHQEYDPARFTFVRQTGTYGTSGMRYRGAGYTAANGGAAYTAGEAFDLTGAYDSAINDGHGTSVAGIVGANRDGTGMHGVAWGANIIVGNTGATDNNNYGPYQDYNFFYTGWKAMVDAGAQVINNSWGTNVRINMQGSSTVPNGSVTGPDGGAVGNMLPANTVEDSEYEYYYYKKMYGDGRSFVDAAYDAVRGTKVVQIMTTGNRDMKNPFYRGLYPYFNPEAESQWIAAAGIKPDNDNPGKLILQTTYNEAGLGKWWTVVGPTLSGNSGNPGYDMLTTNVAGDDRYGSFSGTSCSAPHIAGAMGVLLSRYLNMDASQVRDVMFTTATNQNTDGTRFDLWTSPDGVPDERYGWGLPDLDKGMYGPGQFLGRLEYNASNAPLDVWTNNISQVALDAREVEDTQWLADYQLWLGDGAQHGDVGGAFVLGDGFVVSDNDNDDTNHIVSQADAERWRAEYYAARAAVIQAKIDGGLYDGSLVKLGAGMLVMTGDNTYEGGTTVQGGELYGFTESFGTGIVSVNGGKFGILSDYNDTFTQKGPQTSTETRKADIDVNSGGTYVIIADHDANVGTLTFKPGSKLTVGVVGTGDDLAKLDDAYKNGTVLSGSVTADDHTDFHHANVTSDLAFFDASVATTFGPSGTIIGTLARARGVTFATHASNHNENAIADAIDSTLSGGLYNSLLPATKAQVRATYASLGSDMYLNADNASIVNALSTSRTIKDEALGLGYGRRAPLETGNGRVWMNAIGTWSNLDYGQSDMDVDFYAALLGGEYDITPNNSLGAFIGFGTTKYKGDEFGKIDSDDIHLGIYGKSNIADVASVTYGLIHTRQDRDASRTLQVGSSLGYNKVDYDARITQIFAEAAYSGFNTEKFSVEPFVGLDIMRIKSDGYNEVVNGMNFTTQSNKQTLEVATIGVRGSVPFKLGGANMAVKGSVSGMHFFGDDTPEAYMSLAGSGRAKLEGGKLDNLFGVSFGVEAQLKHASKIGIGFAGAYNGDVESSGVYINAVINF